MTTVGYFRDGYRSHLRLPDAVKLLLSLMNKVVAFSVGLDSRRIEAWCCRQPFCHHVESENKGNTEENGAKRDWLPKFCA